jgi:hypothetical protein
VNSGTNTITIATSLPADIGSYTITVSGTLDSYLGIAAYTATMPVTISACVITSIAANVAMITTASFTFGTPLTIAYPTFTQTPACGEALSYGYLYDGVAT